MSNIKLTPAQKEVIRRMREGYRIHRSDGIHARVSIHGMMLSFPTFHKLQDLGMIEEMDRGERQLHYSYTLTPLGLTISID